MSQQDTKEWQKNQNTNKTVQKLTGKKASQNFFRGQTGQSYEVDGHCPAFSFPFLILTPLRQRGPMLQSREDEEAMVRESISKHRSGTAAESRRSRAIILPDSEDRLG